MRILNQPLIYYRFYRQVDVPEDAGSDDPCWIWMGTKTPEGYGRVKWKRRSMPAHRVAWLLDGKKLPKGSIICHRCDNPSCVNTDHLFVGTVQDNVDDKLRKGRINPSKGENNWRAKRAGLTERDIDFIRSLTAHGMLGTQAKLAKMYNVTSGCISDIVAGKSWKHAL